MKYLKTFCIYIVLLVWERFDYFKNRIRRFIYKIYRQIYWQLFWFFYRFTKIRASIRNRLAFGAKVRERNVWGYRVRFVGLRGYMLLLIIRLYVIAEESVKIALKVIDYIDLLPVTITNYIARKKKELNIHHGSLNIIVLVLFAKRLETNVFMSILIFPVVVLLVLIFDIILKYYWTLRFLSRLSMISNILLIYHWFCNIKKCRKQIKNIVKFFRLFLYHILFKRWYGLSWIGLNSQHRWFRRRF